VSWSFVFAVSVLLCFRTNLSTWMQLRRQKSQFSIDPSCRKSFMRRIASLIILVGTLQSGTHGAKHDICCSTVWAQEYCRISPPRFLAKCRVRRLNQASFVLLCFVLFALSGLCLVFVVSVFNLSFVLYFPVWTNVNSLIVLMCR